MCSCHPGPKGAPSPRASTTSPPSSWPSRRESTTVRRPRECICATVSGSPCAQPGSHPIRQSRTRSRLGQAGSSSRLRRHPPPSVWICLPEPSVSLPVSTSCSAGSPPAVTRGPWRARCRCRNTRSRTTSSRSSPRPAPAIESPFCRAPSAPKAILTRDREVLWVAGDEQRPGRRDQPRLSRFTAPGTSHTEFCRASADGIEPPPAQSRSTWRSLSGGSFLVGSRSYADPLSGNPSRWARSETIDARGAAHLPTTGQMCMRRRRSSCDGVGGNEAGLVGQHYGVHAVADSELGEEAIDVGLDCCLAEDEVLGAFVVG